MREKNSLLTTVMEAALKACDLAARNPGSLVRVTLTGPGQGDVILYVTNYLVNNKLLDAYKTFSNSLKGEATIELTNGSGIEIAIEVPKRPQHVEVCARDIIQHDLKAQRR